MKNNRIKSLESLRALACVAIMISHAGIENVAEWAGAWGVSIFFVLMGFVSMLKKTEDINHLTIKDGFLNMKKKISKVYPVHIFTMFTMVIFSFTGTFRIPFIRIARQLVMNILLIQEWLPFVERSINRTSWYLCTAVLFYLLEPWLVTKIKKRSTKKACRNLLLLYAVQIIVGFIGYKLPRPVYAETAVLEHDIVFWFVYQFPLVRLIDVLIGCNLGKIYMDNKEVVHDKATLYELISIAGSFLAGFLYQYVAQNTSSDIAVLYVNYNKWFTYSIIFTPASSALVYLFAYGQGSISRKLVNKVTMYIAGISPYAFLIHTVVYSYLLAIGTRLFHFLLDFGTYKAIVNLTVGIGITMLLSSLCKTYMSKKIY